MTCERRSAVARLGLGALPEAEQQALRAHLATCAECREGWESLTAFERALSAPVDGPTDDARRAMWRSISESTERRRFAPLSFALPALVAATAVVLAFLLLRPEDIDSGEHVRAHSVSLAAPAKERAPLSGPTLAALAAGETFGDGGLRVQCERDARIVLEELGDQLALTMFAGRVAIDFVADGAAARLVVYAAGSRIETVGGRFVVSADEEVVRVEAGAVLRDGRLIEEPRARARKTTEGEPPPALEPSVEELIAAADVHRLSGELEAAAALYARVAAHADGAPYAEEAMLREARILRELGRADDARAVLKRARERFPNGELEPERAREEKK